MPQPKRAEQRSWRRPPPRVEAGDLQVEDAARDISHDHCVAADANVGALDVDGGAAAVVGAVALAAVQVLQGPRQDSTSKD